MRIPVNLRPRPTNTQPRYVYDSPDLEHTLTHTHTQKKPTKKRVCLRLEKPATALSIKAHVSIEPGVFDMCSRL